MSGETNMQRKVIVVGAGPVGLITALGLARRGIDVTVLERGNALSTAPRAMVHHSAVLPGLDDLGILDDALQLGVKADRGVDYYVFRTGERIRLSMDAFHGVVAHPYNLHLGQDKLGEIAAAHLAKIPGADIRFGVKIVGLQPNSDGVTVQAETSSGSEDFHAEWVVGADGASSAVRRLLDLDFEGITWPQRFIATDIRYDFARYGFNDANLMIDPQYGAVIARVDVTGLWRCTYCEDASLPEETVAERIPQYFSTILPGAKQYVLEQYSPYRMHQRAATTFRRGRVVLAGDAAHVTNPTGGMGLASGLFDSFVLAEALAAVIDDRTDDTVLDRYSQQRRTVFLEQTSPQASAFKQLIYDSDDADELETALAALRHAAANADVRRRLLDLGQGLKTPSLLVDAI
jgi:3-(3-hydroxy-phenyl)propionate hydroxylase/6-hydroxy-3-succinoylpyridine 3-monooxygenase